MSDATEVREQVLVLEPYVPDAEPFRHVPYPFYHALGALAPPSATVVHGIIAERAPMGAAPGAFHDHRASS